MVKIQLTKPVTMELDFYLIIIKLFKVNKMSIFMNNVEIFMNNVEMSELSFSSPDVNAFSIETQS